MFSSPPLVLVVEIVPDQGPVLCLCSVWVHFSDADDMKDFSRDVLRFLFENLDVVPAYLVSVIIRHVLFTQPHHHIKLWRHSVIPVVQPANCENCIRTFKTSWWRGWYRKNISGKRDFESECRVFNYFFKLNYTTINESTSLFWEKFWLSFNIKFYTTFGWALWDEGTSFFKITICFLYDWSGCHVWCKS